MSKEIKLIELCLFAEGYYSGATYIETVFITPMDYIKYFGSGQDTDAANLQEYIENTWDGKEIGVGELDGKHSDVQGEVEVTMWTEEDIVENWDKPSNDGEYLIDNMTYNTLLGGNLSYADRKEIKDNISTNVAKVVEEIGTKVTVKYRVPKDKVDELNAFVAKLNEQ